METLADSVILVGEKQTRYAQMVARKFALKLEIRGMRHSSGQSMYALIKRAYGFRGNRERVYTQFCEYIEKQKELL